MPNIATSPSEPRLIRRALRFERNFTQLPNTWLRDESLSFRARGVLALLMSHENGWHVTLKALASASPNEGIDALRTAVNELERFGYLKRVTLKGRYGKFEGTTWEICDPHDTGDIALFNPVDNRRSSALDHPTTVAPALDKPTRSALDHPTPIRTPVKEHLSRLKQATTEREDAHVDNSGHVVRNPSGAFVCHEPMLDTTHCRLGHYVNAEQMEHA